MIYQEIITLTLVQQEYIKKPLQHQKGIYILSLMVVAISWCNWYERSNMKHRDSFSLY